MCAPIFDIDGVITFTYSSNRPCQPRLRHLERLFGPRVLLAAKRHRRRLRLCDAACHDRSYGGRELRRPQQRVDRVHAPWDRGCAGRYQFDLDWEDADQVRKHKPLFYRLLTYPARTRRTLLGVRYHRQCLSLKQASYFFCQFMRTTVCGCGAHPNPTTIRPIRRRYLTF